MMITTMIQIRTIRTIVISIMMNGNEDYNGNDNIVIE